DQSRHHRPRHRPGQARPRGRFGEHLREGAPRGNHAPQGGAPPARHHARQHIRLGGIPLNHASPVPAILLAALLLAPSTGRASSAAAAASFADEPWVARVLALTHGSDDEDRDDDKEDKEDGDEAMETVPQPDTTISVRPGTALEIENFGGEI